MKIKTKRWVVLIAIIASLFVLVCIVGILRRNAQYDRILKTYSEVLKPGMKRSQVEAYLITSKHVSFTQECCVGSKAWTDLVAIAYEHGWVCQEEVVNVAFQFAATEPKTDLYVGNPEDRLVGIYLDRQGCLYLP